MSELHKFIFEGLPVRGMLVRLDDAWQDMLARRRQSGDYPDPVRRLLGEMTAAAALMQSNIKFNGALVLQIYGDGPVKLAVAEALPDLSLRATANVLGEVAPDLPLSGLVNAHGQGRCAITLDPRDRQPGQQPYQGVVPLHDGQRAPIERLSEVLEHYMLQSEQLDTRLVLAADDGLAAGLLIQRLPSEEAGAQVALGQCEDFNRIAMLAASLKREELLQLDADTVLHRLFWQEPLRRFPAVSGLGGPRFACNCSRLRVAGMLRGLGRDEVESVLAEQGRIEVGCEFCGARYAFDAVDAAQLFLEQNDQPPGSADLQ